MTPPTKKWTRLRRRLAADGNPLRRPADKAAAWLLPAAVVAFLVLSPLAVAAADALAHAGISAAGQAQRSWRQVTATTLVLTHNPFGRVYLAVILPFHRLIARSMLRQLAG